MIFDQGSLTVADGVIAPDYAEHSIVAGAVRPDSSDQPPPGQPFA